MWNALRPWLFPVWCAGCGEPGAGLCAACASSAEPRSEHLDGILVRAAGAYSGVLRAAILTIKHGERGALDPLAALLAPLVAPGVTLVPVPTTRRRAAERGFDQARELARRTAHLAAVPWADLLRNHGGPQRGRGRSARLGARGRFAVRRDAVLPGVAMLVDDVLTTGATLGDAADALMAAGCRVVGALVVARTPTERETPLVPHLLLEG